MPALHIHLDGEGAWPDLAGRDDVIHLADAARFEMGGLAGGMQSGAASVAFRLDLPDGRVVVAETSWRLFAMAFHAFAARFGAQPDAAGMELHTDLTGHGGMTRLDVLPDGTPGFVLCELCGERRESSEFEGATEIEQQDAMLKWLVRHFKEKHPDWTPPAG